ncbi:hypothetical protein QE345_gp155 [Pseudomonas phage vB_PA45_GUMS]|uniref:Uncharacterized protein n=1 Tax=Pseudomonas phage vB_PA45_GUMS TaxID=2656517 RepID=A0A8T8BGN2_9CAUD|nr:hypothetical protein QE345_gp155 [Pseudomonas phage vB_PA45_GUMS]QGK90234.1 hypothetical protein [Pseudomonas phage vB_PA45_GUMS]
MWNEYKEQYSYTPVTTGEIKEVIARWEFIKLQAESAVEEAIMSYSRPYSFFEKLRGVVKWAPKELLNKDAVDHWLGVEGHLHREGKINADHYWVVDFHYERRDMLAEFKAMASMEPEREHLLGGAAMRLIRRINKIYEFEMEA